jgi:nicotinate phosphoribosyltransferase
MKLSDSPAKIPNPGDKRVYRLYDRRGRATADLLTGKDEDPADMPTIVLRHMTEARLQRTLRKEEIVQAEPLLQTILDQGRPAYTFPPIAAIRDVRRADLERLDPGVKRLMNPHIYHVSLSEKMWQMKQKLIASMRADLPRPH